MLLAVLKQFDNLHTTWEAQYCALPQRAILKRGEILSETKFPIYLLMELTKPLFKKQVKIAIIHRCIPNSEDDKRKVKYYIPPKQVQGKFAVIMISKGMTRSSKVNKQLF